MNGVQDDVLHVMGMVRRGGQMAGFMARPASGMFRPPAHPPSFHLINLPPLPPSRPPPPPHLALLRTHRTPTPR